MIDWRTVAWGLAGVLLAPIVILGRFGQEFRQGWHRRSGVDIAFGYQIGDEQDGYYLHGINHVSSIGREPNRIVMEWKSL